LQVSTVYSSSWI